MLNIAQVRELVIRPALEAIHLHSEAAEELVLGTALQESGLRYLKQLGDGPALGLWQMEPATERDLIQNYIRYRIDIHTKMMQFPRYAEIYEEIRLEEIQRQT